ncbi:hypothetical protein V5F36_06875 [Xanthobacter flavus]
MLLQGAEDPLLEHLERDEPAIVARPFLPPRGATELVRCGHDEGAAARAAPAEPGEEVPGLPLKWRIRPPAGEPVLHLVPQLGRDDPQLRHLDHMPRAGGIRARHPLAGVGILHEPLAIPNQPARIELVADDAVRALPGAVDGGGVPLPTSRPGHALRIEAGDDLTWRAALGKLSEDAAHHLGLAFVDLAHAGPRHPIAEAAAARALAFPDAPLEPAVGLQGEVAQEERRHGALEAHVHLRHPAVGDGPDLHAGEGHALVEGGDVRLIAGKAIKILGEDDVEGSAPGILHQPLEGESAVDAGARHSEVRIDLGHGPPLALGICGAKGGLVLDGTPVLLVG